MDVVASATMLLLLLPFFLFLAVAIKLGSPGPVLFRQTRIGQGARPFAMLKFRTMRADARHDIHRAVRDGLY